MTGFGRCQKDTGEYRLFVEVKAVNHKYCEIVVKLPKKLSLFETKIRNILKEYAERGKIDIFLSYESFTGKNECIQYNKELAREYMECIEDMSEEFGIENDMKASMLARLPDVLVLEDQELDEKELWNLLVNCLFNVKFFRTCIAGSICTICTSKRSRRKTASKGYFK